MRFPFPFAALVVLSLAACDRASLGPADASRDGGAAPDAGASGAELYARMCAACHGEVGEGGLGPRLQDWPGAHPVLASIIDARMPLDAPERCDAACASVLATFILTELTREALACEGVPPAPRRLRPLSRRELRATVRDLFGLGTSSADPLACRTRTFELDPAGRSFSSVALAGSFNAWSSTAWPMRWDAARARWTLSRALEDGTHQYKFVLDGAEWVRDTANAETAPDGFGGLNSVIRVACDGLGSIAFDPAAGLLPEPRSEGFPFDDEAAVSLFTAAHVDAQLAASSRILDAVRERLPAIAGCDPTADRAGCTDAFLRRFARRALRRPPSDAELARYAALAAAQPTGIEGIATAIRAMLVSPAFLYRSEMGEDAGDGTYVLDGYEVASALSYALWGTMPDDALLDLAEAGALGRPEAIEREARRMIADPRARETIGDFALMWLGVADVAGEVKHEALYPAWSPALGATMREATRRFAVEVIFDRSHDLAELLSADWGYADRDLAAIYGVSGPSGAALERIARPDRAGVLGEASVLATYAHSDQSSPIQRGLFVRRTLLCQSFPPPPPDAGGVPDVDPSATTRERFRQHTSQQRCARCHRSIDPIGFGFERFDAIGAARSLEGGLPIDASGDVPDVEGLGSGTHAPFSSLPELGAILAGSHAARACFVRQYVRFSRGARETIGDRCLREHLEERFAEHRDVRELMIDVLLAPDLLRRVEVAR